MRRLLGLLVVLSAVLLTGLPTPAQIFQNDGNTPDNTLGINGGTRNRYSVSGDVRDADTREPLARIQVNLRSDDNRTFLATMTDESGRFLFDALPRGQFTVSASLLGYDSTDEQVQLEEGPALGVELRLHKLNSAANVPSGAGGTISAHELAIPQRARDDMEKGRQLLAKGDPQGAIKEFQKAIKEYPKYYEAYTVLGVAYLQTKDTANSEAALQKAIELSNEKFAEPFILLAELYSEKHRFSDAEPMARKALLVDANSWQADTELGRALLGLNQNDEAEKCAEAAVKLQPNRPEPYLLLITVHAKIPNYAAMLQDMNTYLKLMPNGDAADRVRMMRAQMLQALASAPSDSPQAEAPAPDAKP